MGYFVVINVFRYEDLAKIRHLVEDFIIRDLPDTEKPRTTLSTVILDRLTGMYQPATWRFDGRKDIIRKQRVYITSNGGELYYQRESAPERKLVPVTQHLFRFEDEGTATLAFVEHVDGKLFLQGNMGNYVRLQKASKNQDE